MSDALWSVAVTVKFYETSLTVFVISCLPKVHISCF